jgi:hypothetical protein
MKENGENKPKSLQSLNIDWLNSYKTHDYFTFLFGFLTSDWWRVKISRSKGEL